MNIKIDFSALLNTQINKNILESSKDSRSVQILIKFANDHGYFGFDAMKFLMDLMAMLDEVAKAVKEDQDK